MESLDDDPSLSPVFIPYVTSFPGRRKRAKDLRVPVKLGGIGWNQVDNVDHTDEPPTREVPYLTVSYGMTNHFASPIPLTPLQHLSPWLLLSLPLYHQHPSSLVPYHLLFRSPIFHLSFPPSYFPNPLSPHHLPVTFILLPTHPRLPTSPCLLANISRHHQPWTDYTLLSTTSNSKV